MSWAKNSVGERGDNIGLPDVTTADNGKIMEVEGGEWKLKEGSGGGGGIPAPDDPSDGDVLTYDSTAEEWVAAAPGGGGGVLVCSSSIIPDDPDENMILNKTWEEISSAMANNIPVFAITIYNSSPVVADIDLITNVFYDEGTGYNVKCTISHTTYFAATASDYPQTNLEK